jgi:hypothetical protein
LKWKIEDDFRNLDVVQRGLLPVGKVGKVKKSLIRHFDPDSLSGCGAKTE